MWTSRTAFECMMCSWKCVWKSNVWISNNRLLCVDPQKPKKFQNSNSRFLSCPGKLAHNNLHRPSQPEVDAGVQGCWLSPSISFDQMAVPPIPGQELVRWEDDQVQELMYIVRCLPDWGCSTVLLNWLWPQEVIRKCSCPWLKPLSPAGGPAGRTIWPCQLPGDTQKLKAAYERQFVVSVDWVKGEEVCTLRCGQGNLKWI